MHSPAGNESLTEPNDAVAPQEGDNAAECKSRLPIFFCWLSPVANHVFWPALINISIALPDSKAESLQLTVCLRHRTLG